MGGRPDKITDARRVKDSAGLTPARRVVFLHLYESARDKGYQPTIRDMAGAYGVSVRCIHQKLSGLHHAGFIVFPPATRPSCDGKRSATEYHSRSRAIVILRRPDGSPFRGFADKRESDPIGVPTMTETYRPGDRIMYRDERNPLLPHPSYVEEIFPGGTFALRDYPGRNVHMVPAWRIMGRIDPPASTTEEK